MGGLGERTQKGKSMNKGLKLESFKIKDGSLREQGTQEVHPAAKKIIVRVQT